MPDSLRPKSPVSLAFARWLSEARTAARRLSADGHDSEDLAHETLLRALEHPPTGSRPGAWIQRICGNVRIDRWRAATRARRLSQQLPTVSAAVTGEEAAMERQRRRGLRHAVARLPRAQRRALILRYQGGWSFQRISARLGMPEATARTHVHRALVALRARVAALRMLVAPGALALKPALAVLIVLAADPRLPRWLDDAMVAIPSMATAAASRRRPAARHPQVAFAVTRAVAPPTTLPPPDVAATDVVPATSVARPARPHAPSATQARAVAISRLDFENDQVTGDLSQPDEDRPIEAINRAMLPSLIELRREFVPEILKTLEDL